MKTKMKTILSVCMLTVLLYACTNDSTGPLDCRGAENGLAVEDDCGVCYQSYIYDMASHVPTYINDIEDTVGLVLGATEMLILAGSDIHIQYTNDWNNHDLMALDTCGTCHQSYVYDMASHISTDINDTAELVLGATEMLILAGSAADIANNPDWNTGCTE
jgi:hypothetical protein